jgi:hypothetical protein
MLLLLSFAFSSTKLAEPVLPFEEGEGWHWCGGWQRRRREDDYGVNNVYTCM